MRIHVVNSAGTTTHERAQLSRKLRVYAFARTPRLFDPCVSQKSDIFPARNPRDMFINFVISRDIHFVLGNFILQPFARRHTVKRYENCEMLIFYYVIPGRV